MKTGVEKLLTCTVSYVLSLLHKYLVCIQGNYKEGTYYEDRMVWWQKKVSEQNSFTRCFIILF